MSFLRPRRRFSSLGLGLVVAAAAITALACQPAADPVPASTTPAAGTTPVTGQAPPGGRAPSTKPGLRSTQPADTIVVGTNRNPTTLDPNAFWSDSWPEPIYQYVVASENDQFVPALAASWRNLDPSTVQFTLRDGLRWRDGSPIRAQDVKASFDRVKDTSLALASQQRQYVTSIERVDVVDDRTFNLVSSAPDPLIVGRIWRVGIAPAAWLAGSSNEVLANTENGSGPYRVTSFQSGVRIDLERDPASAFPAAMPKFSLVGLVEYAARVAALRSGQVDLVEEVNADDLEGLRRDGYTI